MLYLLVLFSVPAGIYWPKVIPCSAFVTSTSSGSPILAACHLLTARVINKETLTSNSLVMSTVILLMHLLVESWQSLNVSAASQKLLLMLMDNFFPGSDDL
jgi:hypothetical protein